MEQSKPGSVGHGKRDDVDSCAQGRTWRGPIFVSLTLVHASCDVAARGGKALRTSLRSCPSGCRSWTRLDIQVRARCTGSQRLAATPLPAEPFPHRILFCKPLRAQEGETNDSYFFEAALGTANPLPNSLMQISAMTLLGNARRPQEPRGDLDLARAPRRPQGATRSS